VIFGHQLLAESAIRYGNARVKSNKSTYSAFMNQAHIEWAFDNKVVRFL
jgi:hypothetical protein